MPINGLAEKAKYEDLETVMVGDDLKKFFLIGTQLPLRRKKS